MAFDHAKPARTNPGLTDVDAIQENFTQLWKNHKSDTAPTDVTPGSLWLYDPGGGGNWILRMRNPSNDGWIDILTIDATNEVAYPISTTMYISTMTGNETFTAGNTSTPSRRKYLLTPSGGHRNFDPSGTFPAGFEAVVINVGTTGYNVVFDSAGSKQIVAPGQMATFVYTGSIWM